MNKKILNNVLNINSLINELTNNYKIYDILFLKNILEMFKDITRKTHYIIKQEDKWLINTEILKNFLIDKSISNIVDNNSFNIEDSSFNIDNKITKTFKNDRNLEFLNEILPLLDKIMFIRFGFYDKNIFPLYDLKNKLEYHEILEQYNQIIINVDYSIEDKYLKLNDLKNNFINYAKHKNYFLELRKELNDVLKMSKTEWICSIDLEYKNADIAEIGVTLKNTKTKKLIVKNYIIEDYIHKKNKYVRFNYGISKVLSLKNSLKEIKLLTDKTNIIVGNSISSDIKLLKDNGLNLEKKHIFDLNNFNKYFHKDMTGGSNLSLDLMCNELNIKAKNFHNAGNDSYYSIRVFYKLAKKYENMNFEISNYLMKPKEEMIKEKREKNIDIDLKRKIINFKNLYKNANDFKSINHETLDRSELLPVSKLHFFFQEIKKNNFIKMFESKFNDYLNENLNFKIYKNNIYMNIHNFIVFYKILEKEFNYKNNNIDNLIKDFFLTEIKINKEYENSKSFELSFYENNLLYDVSEKDFKDFQITDSKKFNQEKYLKKFIDKPEKYNLLKTIYNTKNLKDFNTYKLLNLLNEKIKLFNENEIPIKFYENILNELFIRNRDDYKLLKYSELKFLKDVEMINITNASLIFNFINKTKIFENFEKYFNPNTRYLPNIKNKATFASVKNTNEICVDFNSFIYLVKNFVEEYNLNFEKNKELSKNLINYIKNNKISNLDFSFDFSNIILNNHFPLKNNEYSMELSS